MINITQKEKCCGCSACVHICPKRCIRFVEDKEGFMYPEIDRSQCVDCGLCEKACPVINQGAERLPLKVYAAKHPDDRIRMKSSSGGIFTLLAEQVIDEGGVVFGARFNESWEVVHDYAETKEGIAPFRGSKYVQSYIGDSYRQVELFLKSGRKVMFTGTPCQVAGLKRYLRKEYGNLLTVDFVCHGVPSPLVWRKYLEEEIARQGEVGKNTVLSAPKVIPVLTGVNFRDKSTGWKKYSFVLNFSKVSAEGERNSVSSSIFAENAYMNAFLSDLSLRPSCYVCPTKSGRSRSDITMGDFWGIESCYPKIDDDRGVSLIMSYCEVSTLLKDALSVELEYVDALKHNQSICSSPNKPINRNLLLMLIQRSKYISEALYYCNTSSRILIRFRRLLYRFLGI